ncbi:MAG: hypothetical protein KME16_08580 [Scytolyngbya sp. HA4215-MV1]|jgi:hypothetical protein|nr:hypothetical protein [Scytolyngbya sp. HA4215-MV1]
MVEPITIWSLFTGSLGLQATIVGGWMRQQQRRQEQQNLQEEEEEAVTRHESRDTMSSVGQPNGTTKRIERDPRLVGWEFKIVRAHRDLFRDSAVLKRLCEEEESAGWIMLEKLDDRRIRFRRPIALRDIIKAEFLPFDPYRSHYGSASPWKTWLLAVVAISCLLLPASLGYWLVVTTLHKTQSPAKAPSPVFSSPSAAPQSPHAF